MAPFVTEVIELIPEGTAVAAGQEIAKLFSRRSPADA